jgi:hypothetical protein
MKLSEIEKVRDESLEEVNADSRLNRKCRTSIIDPMHLIFLPNMARPVSSQIRHSGSFWLCVPGMAGREGLK